MSSKCNGQSVDKIERIACLYLAFLNHPRGLSFAEIRASMPAAYEGQQEAARRKFERDKIELRELGLPLVHYPPDSALPDGRIARDHIYAVAEEVEFLPPLPLGAEQARTLAMVLLGAVAESQAPMDHERALLRSAAARILYLNPEALRQFEQEESSAAQASSDSSAGASAGRDAAADAELEKLALLHQALRSRRVLEFEYRGRSGDIRRRRAAGRGLIAHRRRWCLVAHCMDAKAVRLFYLDRMTAVKIGEARYEKDKTFDIRNYSLHPLALPLENAQTIKVQLDPDRTEQFEDFLRPAATSLDVRWQHGENAASFQTANPEALFQWMLRHSGVVLGLGPAPVHERFLLFVQRMKLRYASGDDRS